MVNKQINIGWLLVGVLFSGNTNNGDHAGFGYANTYYAPSDTLAFVGSRLWQESREKAKYFGQQFIELWFDYLMFNVKKVQ